MAAFLISLTPSRVATNSCRCCTLQRNQKHLGSYEGVEHEVPQRDPNIYFLCYAIEQILRKDAASTKDELNNLGKELDLTQQACSSLQRSFDEYCPDIRRQENEVKRLKNRYTTFDNQLQDR